MAVDSDKLSSMVAAIHLHKSGPESGLVTNQEELDMWNALVVEVAEIVAAGGVPEYTDTHG